MKKVGVVLVALLGLVSVAVGGTIDGKIVGWSDKGPSLQRPVVVWLEGVPTSTVSKTELVMAQHNGQFVPPFLVIVAGQTVNMPNEDEVAHNAYSISGAKKFDLGYYSKGELKTVTFDRTGLVDVHCLIHGFMRAKILVVPNPYYSTVAADGSFRIRNVPEGTFTLAVWGDGMRSFSHEVTVPAGNKTLTLVLPSLTLASQK